MKTIDGIMTMATTWLVFGTILIAAMRLPFRWPLDAILLGWPWGLVGLLWIAVYIDEAIG